MAKAKKTGQRFKDRGTPKTKPKEQKFDELIIVVGDGKGGSKQLINSLEEKRKNKQEAVEAMGGYKDGGRTKLKGGGCEIR